ncbi:MAG: hypothetical protein J6B06_06820 [Lachnospiraceae bacterium]|nr:hypothetical protein [Lachnospiraceae bacterium]
MLTQFFGNYLLEKQVINSDQLLEALRHKHDTAESLDALALSSGYMTAEEVEDVHNMQTIKDVEFVRLALHMGYLTISQASELEEAQHFGYLLLGRAVIELGFCTQEEMAKIIADYEFDYQLSFSNCLNFDQDKIEEMIHHYYQFPDSDKVIPAEEYAVLLIRNLIRFVGDDFRLSGKLDKLPALPDTQEISQNFSGAITGRAAIVGYKNFLNAFANRYACEALGADEEYISAALEDFLNLHNGLFTVNLSTNNNMEVELSAPEIYDVDLEKLSYQYILPIEFTFGTVYFCFNM